MYKFLRDIQILVFCGFLWFHETFISLAELEEKINVKQMHAWLATFNSCEQQWQVFILSNYHAGIAS